VLDVESVVLEVEPVLAVLVDALVLSVLSPSEESAEAMAAASGLTLSEFDEASEASGMQPDVELLPDVCPFAW